MTSSFRSEIKSIAVFCGSNFGGNPLYADKARQLGECLAAQGVTLIYGGTNKGLMGAVADGALNTGGKVVGVLTQRLFERGHLHPALTQHEIVSDMRVRKARMAELADAFIAMPGGYGTLEELFEMLTLTQLGDHKKACALLNVAGYFDELSRFLDHAVQQAFMKTEHKQMLVIESEPLPLLTALRQWQAPTVNKWISQPNS
jgi:uncharacterized protein (TIGR00730 family)